LQRICSRRSQWQYEDSWPTLFYVSILTGILEPPERTTPSGEIVAAESPSVYQSMYRSIFDRQQKPTIQPSKTDGKAVKRARNVFFVVLRYV
jgi:hypothetical protein